MAMLRAIEEIEHARSSRVLVLGASSMEIEILPALYDTLREIGPVDRLDVLVHCRGGSVSAVRRIALLLHECTASLGFIVPHCCESSATVMLLAAREIVAGPVAMFSPAEPILTAPPVSADAEPAAISSQDVRLFGKMSEDWFGLETAEARTQALSVLCANIFPTTLTALYRAVLETRAICLELLSLGHPDWRQEERERIAERLLSGYHSHDYCLTRGDLKELGLPVLTDTRTEGVAWQLAGELRSSLRHDGCGTNAHVPMDATIATRTSTRRRHQSQTLAEPRWEVVVTD